MSNYEVLPFPTPADFRAVEAFETWLEKISKNGGELVAIMPSVSVQTQLAVFRVSTKGLLESFKDKDLNY